jgi:hypothetical protein
MVCEGDSTHPIGKKPNRLFIGSLQDWRCGGGGGGPGGGGVGRYAVGLCSCSREEGQLRVCCSVAHVASGCVVRVLLGGGKNINGWAIGAERCRDKATDSELRLGVVEEAQGQDKKLGRLVRSRGADRGVPSGDTVGGVVDDVAVRVSGWQRMQVQ